MAEAKAVVKGNHLMDSVAKLLAISAVAVLSTEISAEASWAVSETPASVGWQTAAASKMRASWGGGGGLRAHEGTGHKAPVAVKRL